MRTLPSIPLLAVALLVGGCGTATERPGTAETEPELREAAYQRLADESGQVYRLEPADSEIRILAYRAGALAEQGHNHVVTVPAFEGRAWLPEEGLADARFDLVADLADLEVDPPEAREALGHTFGKPFTSEQRQGTRDNMLGEGLLEAERYPQLGLRSVEVRGALPRPVVKMAITLHGVTREQWVPLAMETEDDRLVAEGRLLIRHDDFGLEPFTALGGLLAVQERILVEFRVEGRPVEGDD
ncbi:MAG: YceI family protein [Thiohalospira sp.]